MRDTLTPVTILMADDDDGDVLLARTALEDAGVANNFHHVGNGQELLDYLKREGGYAAPAEAPRPVLILLDLNMPLMDGREALKHLKSDPALRSIPVVVMTTSRSEEDILRSYDIGANSYITKPVSFDGLVDAMRHLGSYWFQIVTTPPVR
jgi:CheY-like chemotaxis protein